MFAIGGILYFAVKLVTIILNSSFRLIAIPRSRFRVPGSGFKVQGSGFKVQGSGFRVQGSMVTADEFVSVHRFKVHRSELSLFISSYKFRQHCFQPPGLNILIQFYLYSVPLSTYESVVQIGTEPEPINLEP